MARTPRLAGVRPSTSPYCRTTVEGINHKVTERRLRQLEQRRKKLVHRAKNGIHDPLTHYQLLDAVLNIPVGQEFTAKHLADWLNEHRPAFVWDAVTIGRVLNDMTESLIEANGAAHAGLAQSRDWSGRYYQTVNDTEGWIALLNLLDDLAILSEEATQQEAEGFRPKRLASPLGRCASLMGAATGIASAFVLTLFDNRRAIIEGAAMVA